MKLDYLAKAITRCKTFHAWGRILTYIEDLEDLRLANKGMKALKNGKVKAIPIDQVERNLGFAD